MAINVNLISNLYSIATENVAGVDLLLDVVEATVVAVCYDGLASLLEFFEVIHYDTTEEGAAVFEGGLVDNNLGAFGFDALHDALDGTLAEVVGVRLHREAVDSDGRHTPQSFGQLP